MFALRSRKAWCSGEMSATEAIAHELVGAGLSIVPIAPNGTKQPTVKWHAYQERQPTSAEIHRWFSPGRVGIGIVGGVVSGNLEILDFDDAEAFEPWLNLVTSLLPTVVTLWPIVKSPSGGFHVYYRAPAVQPNQKLARHCEDGRAGPVRIETRGEGGYVLSPYCPAACHALKRRYELQQGSLLDIPILTGEARVMCLNAARAFDEYVEPPKRAWTGMPHSGNGERPGDRWAAQTSWHAILEPFGWRAVKQQGERIEWQRPGKDERGCSATTGHEGYDQLYVFSTNCPPFEERRGYSKFTVFAMLRCHGDFSRAARLVKDLMK